MRKSKKLEKFRPQDLDAGRQAKEDRIVKKFLTGKVFADRVEEATRLIRSGLNFFEARVKMGVTPSEWDDIQFMACKKIYNPEKAALELLARHQWLYEQAKHNYERAIDQGMDSIKVGQAIMVLSTLDQRQFEVLRELGMIKAPVEVDGGSGYDSNNVIDVENETKARLEQRAIDLIKLDKQFTGPKPIDVFESNEPVGPTDIVGQTSLVARDTK